MKDWKQIAEQAQTERDLLAQELVHLKNQTGFVGNINIELEERTVGDKTGVYMTAYCRRYINRDVERIVHKYIAKTQYNK